MKHIIKIFCLLALFAAVTIVWQPRDAEALRVSLKRVIFEGPKRSEILTIINNSAQEQTYRLGWRKYKMDEERSLRALEDDEDASGVLWADQMIRFAPRRVTIPAGGSQQIRLLLRRPSDLQDAEYRSHLWIVTETKPEAFDVKTDGSDNQAIRLAVQPAISLPIFVRNGKLNSAASITDASLKRGQEGLNVAFTLNRQGEASIYGDFDFVCASGGEGKVIKQIRGISVYTEIDKRILDFDLPLGPETVQNCNSVNVVYRADPDDPIHKGATLAETTVSLN